MVWTMLWLVGGASLYGGLARGAAPAAAWLALILLLHACRSMPSAVGIPCVWLALSVALALGLRGILPVPSPAFYAATAFYALTVALPFAVDRFVAPKAPVVAMSLIFPLAFVTAEFLRSRLSPGATWISIAYTQYGFLPLMQLAALVGIWGITFVLAWGASAFELAWGRNFEPLAVRTAILTCAASIGLILLGGSIRIALAPTDRPSLRMATVNRPIDLFAPGEMTRITEGRVSPDERGRVTEKLIRLQDWFLDASRREAHAGARLIAWPEQNLLVFDQDEQAFLDRARRVALEERVYLALGMGTIHLGAVLPFENKLVLIDPTGTILASYLKSHPVAGWEASIMRLGAGHIPVIATPHGRIATAICFDADFPEFIRQAGRGSADVLIVAANDWKDIKQVHEQMAAFRAIENGVSLLRPAASGISAAVDPWGRVLATSDFFAPGDRTMTAQMPVGGTKTVYARFGDLFAWACIVSLAVTILAAAVQGRRAVRVRRGGQAAHAYVAK